MSSTSPKKEIEKKKKEIIPQNYISALTDDITYGLLLRPINVKNEKLSVDISKIFSISGSDAEPKKEGEEPTNEEKQLEKDRKSVSDYFTPERFQAKLLTAEDITAGKYILLPLPRDIRDSLSVNYSAANIGSLMAGIQLGNDAQQSIAGQGSIADAGRNLGNYIVRAAIDLLPNARAASAALTGTVLNPYTQTVFENVDLRSFNFEFVFQPKNKEESDNIREIINLIRYYALPDTIGAVLEVPWYWELAFYGDNAEYLHAFSRCVLSRIDTNYSQDGFPVFTTANAPKTIVLTLEFKEVFPLNKKVITNFGNPSMTPRSTMFDSDGNAGDNEVEQSVNPEDGTPAQQPDNTEQELKKQIRNLDSEISTINKKLAELNQYLTRTDLTAKQRSDAQADVQIQLKQIQQVAAAKQAAENQLNGG